MLDDFWLRFCSLFVKLGLVSGFWAKECYAALQRKCNETRASWKGKHGKENGRKKKMEFFVFFMKKKKKKEIGNPIQQRYVSPCMEASQSNRFAPESVAAHPGPNKPIQWQPYRACFNPIKPVYEMAHSCSQHVFIVRPSLSTAYVLDLKKKKRKRNVRREKKKATGSNQPIKNIPWYQRCTSWFNRVKHQIV